MGTSQPMDTSQLGISLLLTLLTEDRGIYRRSINVSEIDPSLSNANEVQENINTVVQGIEQFPGPSRLIRNIARRELYDVLYEIIKKAYEEPQHEPETPEAEKDRELNQTLTGAIGFALEKAISEASDARILELRKELRKKIVAALTPK